MSENGPKFIPVTRVELHDLGDGGPTKAIGSVTIGDVFVVHGIRVVESDKGLFVAMPQRKDGDRYRDVAHPITLEMRSAVGSAVLDQYQRLKARDIRVRTDLSR